jgi:hypothetical protein
MLNIWRLKNRNRDGVYPRPIDPNTTRARINPAPTPAFRVLDFVRDLPHNAGFHVLILIIKVFKRREKIFNNTKLVSERLGIGSWLGARSRNDGAYILYVSKFRLRTTPPWAKR